MGDLSVQQQQNLAIYLKANPGVSRDKAIQLLFSKDAAPAGAGISVEHTEPVEQSTASKNTEAQEKAAELVNSGKMNYSQNTQDVQGVAADYLSKSADNAMEMFEAQNEKQGSISDLYNSLKENFGSDEAASEVYARLSEEQFSAQVLELAKDGKLTEKTYWEMKTAFAARIANETSGETSETYKNLSERWKEIAAGVKTFQRTVTEQVQTDFKKVNAPDSPAKYAVQTKEVKKTVEFSLPMEFNEVFKNERGVEFSEQAVNDYSAKEAQTQFLVNMNNKMKDIQSKLNLATSYSDFAEHGGEYMMDPSRAAKLNIDVYCIFKEVYGSDKNIAKGLEKLGLMGDARAILDDWTGSFSKAAAKSLSQYMEKQFKAACGDKTFEQHQKECSEAYIKAYGNKNSEEIAQAYIKSQKEGVQSVKGAVQGAGMVAMIAGQFVPGGTVATALITGGFATATLGGSAIQTVEDATKAGGMTKEDAKNILEEVATSAALTAAGMGIGKISSALYGQLILKNCPMLLAKVSEIGADATMGLLSNYALTGELDLKGEGISQLIPLLAGILKTKIHGNYAYGKIPFNKIPKDVPQTVIPKKQTSNLYPKTDAAEIDKMKENLKIRAQGTEDIKLDEITGKPYQKEVEFTFGNSEFDFLINEPEHRIITQNDGDYRIYKATQSGSNPGFWVEHINSGDLYYFKTGNGMQNITEHVSSQLYRAAGIDTPDMDLVASPNFNSSVSTDNCWIKSKAITGLKPVSEKPEAAYEGFAVDAWLANWDAVCSGNTMIKNGTAVRLDFGGSLNFRAQGAKKNFGNQVPELSTLLDSKINPESASLFKNMTREDLIGSLKRVQSVTDNDIQKIYNSVNTYMNPEIFETIKNRKTYLNYILKEAEATPAKEGQTIQEYVKLLEENVSKKYAKQIKYTNLTTEKRARLMNDMRKQRDAVFTQEDSHAAWKYKGSSYTANTCIQQGDTNNPLVTSLDKALSKTQLTEDAVLYRGDHLVIDMNTNLRYRDDFQGITFRRGISDGHLTYYKDGNYDAQMETTMEEVINKIFKKGKIVEEQQFVSTTVNENVAKSFSKEETDIIYRYHAPKGTHATSLEGVYSDEFGDAPTEYLTGRGGLEGSETEILLKRGFKYRMDNLTFEDGHYIIDCTILK